MNASSEALKELRNISFLSNILQKPYALPTIGVRTILNLNTNKKDLSNLYCEEIGSRQENELKLLYILSQIKIPATSSTISINTDMKVGTIRKRMAHLRIKALVHSYKIKEGEYKNLFVWELTPRGLELANSYLELKL